MASKKEFGLYPALILRLTAQELEVWSLYNIYSLKTKIHSGMRFSVLGLGSDIRIELQTPVITIAFMTRSRKIYVRFTFSSDIQDDRNGGIAKVIKQHLPSNHMSEGAQWLSGRVLDSKLRGRGFEPHRRHCVVVLEQGTFILA